MNTTEDKSGEQCLAAERLSPLVFAELWGELIEAQHGVQGRETNTAIICAGVLGRKPSPRRIVTIMRQVGKTQMTMQAIRNTDLWRCETLHSLTTAFARVRDCVVTVDGLPPDLWLAAVKQDGHYFSSLISVRVESKS